MRKTIYVPNEETWEKLKGRAKSAGLSVSAYLISPFSRVAAEMDKPGDRVSERLDRIEGMLQTLIDTPRKLDATRKGFSKVKVRSSSESERVVKAGVPAEEYDETIKDGQAKLDAIRKDRNIKMDKIEKVRAKVESVTGSSGGYSKSHQVRKKGKGGDAE